MTKRTQAIMRAMRTSGARRLPPPDVVPPGPPHDQGAWGGDAGPANGRHTNTQPYGTRYGVARIPQRKPKKKSIPLGTYRGPDDPYNRPTKV